MNLVSLIIRSLVALLAGGTIGLAFGAIQSAALRRYQSRQSAGNFNSGFVAIPGSMTRVAFLLMALALIQLVCPMLFLDNVQWMVSTGLVLGYGWCLFRQFRSRRASMT